MKTLFIEAKYKGTVKLDPKTIKKLPKKLGIVSTIQFTDNLKDIQKQLPGSIIAGQILGCRWDSAKKIAKKVDAFLYIGTGGFHPTGLAYELAKPVFTYNPGNDELSRVTDGELEDYNKKRKGALVKFLSAANVGILVTTKPGQNYPLEKIKTLEKKYKDKNFYTFISDTIDLSELENFPFIESWVNTACPRLPEDTVGMVDVRQI